MSAYPKGFVPDLRRLRHWPSLRDSLWRNPDLVRLTYGELVRVVQAYVGPNPRRILYVGPGLGHVALELARGGHDVTGVDIDQESVALATRAAEIDPLRRERGPLTYQIAEFPAGFLGTDTYDGVLFCRVLHHIEDPAAAVARAADLLRPRGFVVCVEFAYDRLGPVGARWIARSRIQLSRQRRWPDSVAGSLDEETQRLTGEWRADHEDEGLNPFRRMLQPLEAAFTLRRPAWHPYLFWDLAAEMHVRPDREGQVARDLHDDEVSLLRHRRLEGVLFSTIGRTRRPDR